MLDRTCALLGALVAVVVTALPTAGVLMAVVAALGGSISYAGALPVGLLAGLLPLAVAVGLAERP